MTTAYLVCVTLGEDEHLTFLKTNDNDVWRNPTERQWGRKAFFFNYFFFLQPSATVMQGGARARVSAERLLLQRSQQNWIMCVLCLLAALAVSAGSDFTPPDHQPLWFGVAVATVLPVPASSFPTGIGPPAVTCRKIPSPVRAHTLRSLCFYFDLDLFFCPFVHTNINPHHNVQKPYLTLTSISVFSLKFKERKVTHLAWSSPEQQFATL